MDWIALQIRWWLNEIRSKYYRFKSNRMKKNCNSRNHKIECVLVMTFANNSISFWIFFSLKIFRNSILVRLMLLTGIANISLWWSLCRWLLAVSIATKYFVSDENDSPNDIMTLLNCTMNFEIVEVSECVIENACYLFNEWESVTPMEYSMLWQSL